MPISFVVKISIILSSLTTWKLLRVLVQVLTISQLTKQLKKGLLSSILQVPMLTLLKKLFWPLSYSQHVTILQPMLGLTHLVVTMFLNKLKQVRNSLLVARLLVRHWVLSGSVLLVHVLPMMLTVWEWRSMVTIHMFLLKLLGISLTM